MPAGEIDELASEDKARTACGASRAYWRRRPAGRSTRRRSPFRLAEIAATYDVQAIGYDDWRFADLAKILSDEGIELPLKPVRQGFKTMAAASTRSRGRCRAKICTPATRC